MRLVLYCREALYDASPQYHSIYEIKQLKTKLILKRNLLKEREFH